MKQNTPSNQTMNHRIDAVMRSKSMTSEALAFAIQTEISIVDDWLDGRSQPSGEQLELLCTLFHCSTNWLASGRGLPPASLDYWQEPTKPLVPTEQVTLGGLPTEKVVATPKSKSETQAQPKSRDLIGRGLWIEVPRLNLSIDNWEQYDSGSPTFTGEAIRVPFDMLAPCVNFQTHTQDLGFIYAFDYSMAPTFRESDLLIIDTKKTSFTDSGVYVFATPQGLFIKRYDTTSTGMAIWSSDKDPQRAYEMPTEVLSQTKVFGRVVAS